MNTDFIVWDQIPREKQYIKNITSKGDTRYYNDSCSTIKQYAREQNTVYDPITNSMLYGINTNMRALGVSDGTCNQINPYILQQNNICGMGAAGGNRCRPDANGIENFSDGDPCDNCNVTRLVVIAILIVFLLGIFYVKSNPNSLK